MKKQCYMLAIRDDKYDKIYRGSRNLYILYLSNTNREK